MFIPHFQCKKWFLVQSWSLRLTDQKWNKKKPKYPFLPPFIIAFLSQVKTFKLLTLWHQGLWGISANVNNIFGLFTSHSFTNSTFIDNSSQSHHKIHDLYNRTNKTENLIDGLFQLCLATLYFCIIKFIYSEKATKFCEIFPLLLTTVNTVKNRGRFRKILWLSQNIWTLL